MQEVSVLLFMFDPHSLWYAKGPVFGFLNLDTTTKSNTMQFLSRGAKGHGVMGRKISEE